MVLHIYITWKLYCNIAKHHQFRVVMIIVYVPCAFMNNTLLIWIRFSHGLKIFFGRRSLAWIYIAVKEFYMSIIQNNFIRYRLMTCKIISLYVGSDELGRLFHFPNLSLEITFL
ncbi:COBW domain-containing protein 1 isoform X1 [Iris pallida]|uniref:COBW domain-containing protein 1 isoform X1 n=1 Tax=Iris pallida TaxID=29817 RepID=A0AAX6DW30_IRIPA|nr:COBW domain-containing protein 1 isoform X1 [Iris pallida]KAJ6847867.1 COBW domain-containing protein 1 isoform X1 [Iris pallida]